MQPDVEMHSTGELISDWLALARYKRTRTVTERILDCALYLLWAFALVAFIVALFVRR